MLCCCSPSAFAQITLVQPLAPVGSAKAIGMASALVALGGEGGAVPVNPAAISSVDSEGGTDVMGGGGQDGSTFFAIHTWGQSVDKVPGALWAANLNGPGASEQLVAYSVASSTVTNLDVGATIRYERWGQNGDVEYVPNADIGLRYASPSHYSLGLSGVNLLHPDLFTSGTNPVLTETQVIAAVGTDLIPRVKAEAELVYTKSSTYGRFGGELRIAPGTWVRAGLSDKDVSAGATLTILGNEMSVAVVIPDSQQALYALGFSSHF